MFLDPIGKSLYLKDFQSLYLKHYGRKITESEAEIILSSLADLLRIAERGEGGDPDSKLPP